MLDVRRLFMTKDGYRGTRIHCPSGTSIVQQPDGSTKQIPNHEIAMQIVETIRTGGVFALPSEVDANGTPRWKVEESQISNNPSHILQYLKEPDARSGISWPKTTGPSTNFEGVELTSNAWHTEAGSGHHRNFQRSILKRTSGPARLVLVSFGGRGARDRGIDRALVGGS